MIYRKLRDKYGKTIMKYLKSIIYLISIFSISFHGYSQTSLIFVEVKTTGAKLTESKEKDSKVLKILNAGDRLELLGYPESSSQRFRVRYQELEGFVTSYFIRSNKELDSFIVALKVEEAKNLAKYKVEQKVIQDSLRKAVMTQFSKDKIQDSIDYKAEIVRNDSIADAMLKNIKSQNRSQNQQYINQRREKFQNKYGKEVGEKITTKNIWIGMTEEMLLDSWGKPNDINQTVTKYSNRKQYVYGSSQYVYVEGGVVTAYQN